MRTSSVQDSAVTPLDTTTRGVRLLVCGALLVATLAAYWNSWTVPFLAEDVLAITDNPTLQEPGSLRSLFSPPPDSPFARRPLLNATFALNRALSGNAVWSYHAVNVAVHLLAGVTLFGVLRRIVRHPKFAPRVTQSATGLATLVAVLWLLHPLQTGAVTHVVQRATSMGGLFYLLTLYAFVRGTESMAGARGLRWLALSVAACFAGVATHETLLSAPFVVLVYDGTFVARSFAEAWRRRRFYYLLLATSWWFYGWLVWNARGTAQLGFDPVVGPGAYLVTQAYAIALYLKLALWPAPLVFDYGPRLVVSLTDVWPQALLIVALLAATTELVGRRSALGFAGAWFFGVLAPTSSLLPNAEHTVAEPRMYLPLAAVLALAVLGAYRWLGRGAWVLGGLVALALGWATHQRNETYRSEFTLWQDTLEHRPANVRALHGLGMAYARQRNFAEAVPLLQQATQRDPELRFVPKPAVAHRALAQGLVALGRPGEALTYFEAALVRDPYAIAVHYDLARGLMQLGRPEIAVRHFREVVRLARAGQEPPAPLDEVHHQVGLAYEALDRPADALTQYRAGLEINPNSAALRRSLEQASPLVSP